MLTSREVNFILGGIIIVLLTIVISMSLLNTRSNVEPVVMNTTTNEAVMPNENTPITNEAAPEITDDWQTYTNTDVGFAIMIPKGTKVEDGTRFSGDDFEIVINSNQEFEYKQDGEQISETPLPFARYAACDMTRDSDMTLNGLKAAVFKLPKGCCDAAACTKPYIMHSIEQVLGRRFDITAYGDTSLNDTEGTIVNSFRFVK